MSPYYLAATRLCDDGDAGARSVATASTGLDAKKLLASLPRGAYTTARTSRARTAVFELEAHVQRIADSALLMAASNGAGDLAIAEWLASDNTQLHAAFVSLARRLIDLCNDQQLGGMDYELKLTGLLVWGAEPVAAATTSLLASGVLGIQISESPRSALLVMHADRLLPRRSPPIKVLVHGSPRQNARAKDSTWIAGRVELERLKSADVEEVILVGEGGALLEGLQTNFFVVTHSGRVQTADGGEVLLGTVRTLVLEVCASAGIPVDECPPRLADAATWQGAFLTSTSRLVLPIDELQLPGGAPPLRWAPQAAIVQRIEALVAACVEARSAAV